MREHLDDILILLGCGVLLYATYLLSPIGALFLSGVFLIVAGWLAGLGGSTDGGCK